ncbi:MAG: hypothetical protein H6818_24170 [Phycisphaerales bacterium]|nr:hypothetical protein [Phycisphaerales bacterium]
MDASEGSRYFNDDGTEFNPDLIPTPDLCVSCKSHEIPDAEEEVLCNLTRADQQGDDVFLCHAYRPISPTINREDVLRDRCRQAGIEYSEERFDMEGDDPGILPF